LGITVWLLFELVIFPLVFQFIIGVGLELIISKWLELLEVSKRLDRWLILLERIFILIVITLTGKISWVHLYFVIVELVRLSGILSEWWLRCWFEALLMSIEFKFFVQASLVKAT